MKTVNSISGGKSSAYIAAHYPADYNLFSLVRTNDTNLLWQQGKDEKTRQLISDRIGVEFIGTLEDDMIIYTILDLEQYIGREIKILTGKPYEDILKRKKGNFLPSKEGFRFCTTLLKILPIYRFLRKKKTGIVETRIGFRADEKNRVEKKLFSLDDGIEFYREIPYSIPKFPMWEDGIRKIDVNDFWKDKPVRFAFKNNCVGCFWRPEPLLNMMAQKYPDKMEWFAEKEDNTNSRWKKGTTYRNIIKKQFTLEMDFEDFSECDYGSCTS